MTRKNYLFPIVLASVYFVFLAVLSSSSMSSQAFFITGLSVTYLIANIIHAMVKHRLSTSLVLEVGVVAILAQYVLLFIT